MGVLIRFGNWTQDLLDKTRALDFLAPLSLRVYLAPVLWVSGVNKLVWDGELGQLSVSALRPNDGIVEWFANPDWGLGLPMPELMALLATWSEVGGAILLVLGLATRWISIPLMVTMGVAAFTVHWHNGWQAVADPMSPFPPADIAGAMERLERARAILQEHANYEWLTERGSLVISNNGTEWAATYFIMLLVLLFIGGGRYVSLDHWIARAYRRP
jgi:uncharacterized membrane protein YphA (DoxX/SURF4 family)